MIALLGLLFVSSSVFAQDGIVKDCSVSLKQMDTDKVVDMKVQVATKSGVATATITQTVDRLTSSYTDVVEISEHPVRAGLMSASPIEGLNAAESLVVHAMRLGEDSALGGHFSAGVDLRQIRSARLFAIGAKTTMGSSTIVEARDAEGRILGSFLGGFMVSPCR